VLETAIDEIVVPIEPVFYEAPPAVVPAPPEPAPAVEPISAPAFTPEITSRTRRWQTWQLIAAVAIALVLGVVVGRATTSSSIGSARAKSSRTGDSTNRGAQPAAGTRDQLPPASGSAAPTSTPAQDVNGHAVLLNIPRQTGPVISQHFTATGSRWALGWAYDCTAAPGGTGTFNVKVMDGSGEASNDGGIDQQGAKGSSVVAYTSTGERYLWITTNCVWAIRVTT
jgi:hypothetical protein